MGKIDGSALIGAIKKKRLFKRKKRKEHKILIIALSVLAAFVIIFVVGVLTSLNIKTSNFIIEYGNLPKSFDGFKIVQISDYHKGVYANDNEALLEAIKNAQPDVIVMTGDMIDKKSSDISEVVNLCENLVDISAVIWIRGNHFYKTDDGLAKQLEERLAALGVVSLVNECYIITRDGENIKFCGVDDPETIYEGTSMPPEYAKEASASAAKRFLSDTEESSNGTNGFKILLSHRYSQYELFPEYGYSLTLAGHSHGGQIKFPGGIDLIGYDLKLFPKVKSGYNNIDGMPLIVSSGLGTSNINLRLYNPAEVVVVELKNK